MRPDTLQAHFQALKSFVSADDYITKEDSPGSEYKSKTAPWSIASEKHPKLVLEPKTEDSLAKIVRYLGQEATELDFAVRGSGCGNSSASDVLISMGGFKEIRFDEDKDKEILYVGAGNEWGEVDVWLDENAPGYVVVGSRCPFVGVTGSTLMGGLSWLSPALGLGSDPNNMLDVRIVLLDGRAIWASAEPELLWALRGGGGNFGVVTTLALRAHRYPSVELLENAIPSEKSTSEPVVNGRQQAIWSGLIHYKDASTALPILSKRVAEFSARNADPLLALHVFVVDNTLQALHGGAAKPNLFMLPFDARGEAHARSADGFAWALDVPGADASACHEMPLSGVHALQAGQRATHAMMETWLEAALIGDDKGDGKQDGGIPGRSVIDEHLLERCWAWYEDVISDPETNGRFGLGAFALVEIMRAGTMTGGVGSETGTGSGGGGGGSGITGPESTAWPHYSLGRKNVLQLGIGCAPGKSPQESLANEAAAMKILERAPEQITGKEHPRGHFLPNFTLPIHDVSAIFGGNWERLRGVKSKYDRGGRLGKGVFVPPS